MRIYMFLASAFLSAALSLPAAVAHAETRVFGVTGCIDADSVRRRLDEVLKSAEALDKVTVTVDAQRAVDGFVVALRAVLDRNGAILLDREVRLTRGDCAASGDVLALMLREFFAQLSPSEIEDPSPPPAPEPIVKTVVETVTSVETREVVIDRKNGYFGGFLSASVDARLPSVGGDVELGLGIDYGSERHRLTGGITVRQCLPETLAEGSFSETLAMLDLGWSFSKGALLFRLFARFGGLWIVGHGFESDYRRWVLWLEGQAQLMWHVGRFAVGPTVGASPLSHRVHTREGAQAELSFLRVGVAVSIDLFAKRF